MKNRNTLCKEAIVVTQAVNQCQTREFLLDMKPIVQEDENQSLDTNIRPENHTDKKTEIMMRTQIGKC